MDNIRSRLWAQICPQLEGPARSAGAVLLEVRKRACDALLDARHRMRTGRPRGGMRASYVHPPLPCSHGCSKPAQRVHGLLYGYSLAYSEVRPRVETIAEVRGCGTSTVRNALGELRRAGLLVVHERHGKDQRRLANRYEVRFSSAERAPLSIGGAPAESQRTRRQISDLRSGTENSSRASAFPRPKPVTAPRPAVAAAVSEDSLVQAVGEERGRKLRAHFAAELGELLRVVALEHALELPGALSEACDRLIESRGNVEKPAAYLRSTLRAQRELVASLERELAELGTRRDGLRAAGDREQAAEVGLEIGKLKRRLDSLLGRPGIRATAVIRDRSTRRKPVDPAPSVPVQTDLAECLKEAERVLEVLRQPANRKQRIGERPQLKERPTLRPD